MIFDIYKHELIDSTMNKARDMADSDAMEWCVVQAESQNAGRGRHGNQWTSPKGNLYKTVILRPTVSRQNWGQLSFVIAVALGQAIHEIKPQQVYTLKWPNDVLIDNQKLAGILIESYDDYALVGTGVNIEYAPHDRSKLHDFCDITVDDFRDIFLENMKQVYDTWQADGLAPIREKWMRHAYKLGEPIKARLPHITYEGIFQDLDETGILILREKDGSLRQIHSGEIIHVPGD